MGIRNNTSPSGVEPQETAEVREEKAREALRVWAQENKALTDVFLDAFCIVDTGNRVVDFNVAFTELCGESYRKILKIGDFCELLHMETCPENCPARQILKEKKSLRLDELSGSTKAYPHLQVILGGVPIFSASGEAIGSLITVRNVSAESELQKKYDERKKESITDGLTRLFNKVYTEGALLRMVKGSYREMSAISVVMCDIDHFKKVNDTYGHQAGDHVLSIVAQMLKGESRETDVVGRFGGEEFIAVLANSDRVGAFTFAERFRKRVAATEITFEGKHIPVTVSLGTATIAERWTTNTSPDQTVKELVSRADTALYFAKANGRNQTTQQEAIADKPKPEKKAASHK